MITEYFRERFRAATFGPLAVAIAVGAAAGRFDAGRLVLDVLFALLLLAEFRLWDDLADRDADAASHPTRVVVRAVSLRPLVAVTFALAVVNVIMAVTLVGGPVAPASLIAVHLALGLWYARRRRRTLAGDQLLLAKYPAFVVIVAGARVLDATLLVAVAALLLYAAASLFEAWHDPASPGAAFLGGRS